MNDPRTTARRSGLRPMVALTTILLATALLAGCGDESAELREANETVKRLEAEVDAIEKRVADAKARAQEADEVLEQAREDLARAEEELAAARERVATRASDTRLFHAVQRRLLEADALENVAISARVESRVVTLEGRVPEASLKERAEEIAASTAGVQKVVNQIRVAPAQSAGSSE